MPDHKLLELARDSRQRAEEALIKAETFRDAFTKNTMREIAANYQKLAERLEHHAYDAERLEHTLRDVVKV